jgi:cell wall-associated NlpC family hydrolase
VATHRRFGLFSGRRAVVAVGIAAALTVSFSPGIGQADPRPSIDDVQKRIDALNDQADRAVEAYAQARIALTAARHRAAVAQGQVLREAAALVAVRHAMNSVAASAYRTGGTDVLVSLVSTNSPQTFLDRASALDRIARDQAARLAATATARHRLAGVEAEAKQALAEQRAAEQAVGHQRDAILRTLREQRSLLAGLQAEERARLARIQREREAESRRAALRASRLRSFQIATYTGPASGRAGVAVAEAYNKLGSPYEWAAAGPSRFDCSGLTMWVWAKAGVSLPHSAAAQYDSINHVAQSDTQPGDLVFFGSPIHHVGIYIGNGQMISAPHTGDVVKIQGAFRSDFVGAGRP